ncbi:MAG: TonB-dependent receptor [Mucilaginibacter polytrichastri]|nr:TonB-dependent receptor [Mucilaginibacter polytrichastri]
MVNIKLTGTGDTTTIRTTTADSAGFFRISASPYSKYRIFISGIGYVPMWYGPLEIRDQSVQIPDKELVLVLSNTQLDEVEVSAHSAIEVEPGKTTVNVDKAIYSGSVYDILARIPGVRIGSSGDITLKGRPNPLIMIDGRPTNLSMENIGDMLRGMQSNTVDQIELMTVPPPRYEASGSAGVINIRLKKDKSEGTNGSLTAGYGQGYFYKSSTGLTLNHHTQRWNFSGSYGYGDNKRLLRTDMIRNVGENGSPVTFDVNNRNVQVNQNHTVKAAVDYAISSRHSLGVAMSGTYSGIHTTKNNITQILSNRVIDSTVLTNSAQNRKLNGTNFTAVYAGKLDTLGTQISAEGNYFRFRRNALELQDNYFNDSNGMQFSPNLLYTIGSPSNVNIYSVSADLVRPFSSENRLDAGLKLSRSDIRSRFDFERRNQGLFVTLPDFSNAFDYEEDVYAGYANYHAAVEKWSFDIGARGEYTRSLGIPESGERVDRRYFNFFPNLQAAYDIDDDHGFSASFSRRINRPLYSDLNPFVNFLDPYSYYQGNPRLRPEYASLAELSYQHKKMLFTLRYSAIRDFAFNLTTQNDESRVIVATRVNLGKQYTYGAEAEIPLEFSPVYTLNLTAGANYYYFANTGMPDKSSPAFNLKAVNRFDFGQGFLAEIAGNYESPQVYGINNFNAVYSADLALSKTFLQKRLELKCSVTDLTNSYRDRFYIRHLNINLNTREKPETRIARLNLTYRFGNQIIKRSLRGPANQEEQERTRQ